MLKLTDSRTTGRRPRCVVYPGQKVSRKYRRAVVRRMEYRRLQRLIPNIARRKRVPELTVILEAVRYIDELHSAIADRVKTIQGLQLLGDRKRPTPEGSDVIQQSSALNQQVHLLNGHVCYPTPPPGSATEVDNRLQQCGSAERRCSCTQVHAKRPSVCSRGCCEMQGAGREENTGSVKASLVPASTAFLSDVSQMVTTRNRLHTDYFQSSVYSKPLKCKR